MATKPALAVDNTRPPAVYAAIAAVSADMAAEGISKARRNQQQGYQFRGIDDVYNALAPVLAKHGLCIVPFVLERWQEERETKSGGRLAYVTVQVRYHIIAANDGSAIDACMFGEAMDSADKATNKALSAAYKYLAMQLFCIPTEGDNDADATTPEPVKAKPRQTARDGLSPDQPWPDDFDDLALSLSAVETKAELNKWCNDTAEQRAKWPQAANDKMRGFVVERQRAIKQRDEADTTRAG